MSTFSEASDTPNDTSDGAAEDSAVPSSRVGIGRILVAIASTYLVVVMALAAIPGPTHRGLDAPLRWVGLDQSWEMFTYPPHDDSTLAATAVTDGAHAANGSTRVVLPFDQQPEFRWRRYRAWLRQAGSDEDWGCFATFLVGENPDLAITTIEFSVRRTGAKPVVVKSVRFTPGSSVASNACKGLATKVGNG